MALFGSSSSKFKGSDAVVISLNHSLIEPQWAETNIIRNKSVLTAETTFIKAANDIASFIVTVNIWKNSVPADTMNTILPYNHDTVNFMPHEDSATYVKTAGSEVVTNGTFDADVSGWVDQGNHTIAWGASEAEITSSGAGDVSANRVYQQITTIPGALYKLSFTMRGSIAQDVHVIMTGGMTVAIYTGAVTTSNVTFTKTFTAVNATSFFILYKDASGNTLYLDNVSIVELTDASFYIESMTPLYIKNQPPILEDYLVIRFVALEEIDVSGSIP